MDQPVRVRIAPSPTGYFHVGTARTAIYNYLFARRRGGAFVLRIEDTDLDRSESQYVDVILDGLRWLGIEWDEGPVHQADRLDLYRPYAQKLLDAKRAYRCYCTPEELNAERERARSEKLDWKYSQRCRHLTDEERIRFEAEGRAWAVRLAIPFTGETSFHDLLAGHLSRQNSDIEDFVIARSDGRALYNFAVVIDDHLMQISHVIRGNDHITNTYKQVRIYEALEWESPEFAHVPLILRYDKSKVSKRKGDPSVIDYRDQGYLPEALLNYLCLLGWSPGDDREIFSLAELIDAFELERVSQANPVFDPTKLEWMNGDYIRRLPGPDLANRARPFFAAAGLASESDLKAQPDRFERMVELLRERCKTLADFPRLGAFFFRAPTAYDEEGAKKNFKSENSSSRLRDLEEAWNKLPIFESEYLDSALRERATARGLKPAAFIHPARLALTGMTAGPGLFELAAVLGREECTTRLLRAAAAIESGELQASPATGEKLP